MRRFRTQAPSSIWCIVPVIPVLLRQRQGCECKVSMGYTTRLCLRKPKEGREGGREDKGGRKKGKKGKRKEKRIKNPVSFYLVALLYPRISESSIRYSASKWQLR
jgi:hypothetical protein